MTKDKIIEMAREAGLRDCTCDGTKGCLERFAALVAAAKDAEHKEAMRWDIHSCGPTCKRYACVATREAVAAEREACAKVCDEQYYQHLGPEYGEVRYGIAACAAAIRARKP